MPKKKKAIMGRPVHEPTEASRAIVKVFTAAGLTQKEIAKYLKLDPKTLAKHYGHEIENGWVEAIGDAATTILTEMRSQDSDKRLDAAKFFLTRRSRGLWSEVKQHEISGPNGSAIPMSVDLDALGCDELETLDQLLAPAIIEGEIVDADADAED